MPNIIYTVSERIEIVLQHAQGLSFRKIADHFAAAYPDRPIPSVTTIRNMVEKFRKTGTVHANFPKVIVPSRRISDEIKLDVFLKIEEGKTAVQIAKDLQISKTSVRRILREGRSKPSKNKSRPLHPPVHVDVKQESTMEYEELRLKPEPAESDSSDADEPDPESDPLSLNEEAVDIKQIRVKIEPFSTEP